jgi:hypothetical protein
MSQEIADEVDLVTVHTRSTADKAVFVRRKLDSAVLYEKHLDADLLHSPRHSAIGGDGVTLAESKHGAGGVALIYVYDLHLTHPRELCRIA